MCGRPTQNALCKFFFSQTAVGFRREMLYIIVFLHHFLSDSIPDDDFAMIFQVMAGQSLFFRSLTDNVNFCPCFINVDG